LLDPIFKFTKEDGVTLYGIGHHEDKFIVKENEDYYT